MYYSLTSGRRQQQSSGVKKKKMCKKRQTPQNWHSNCVLIECLGHVKKKDPYMTYRSQFFIKIVKTFSYNVFN